MDNANTKKTVLRVAKLNKYALKGTSDHSMRKTMADNVDSLRTHLNAVLIGSGNIKDDVISYIYKNRTAKTAIRKDAVYAEEVVLSASPDFFLDQDITKKWVDEQVNFLKQEYNLNCVSAVLHLDETTPHIHAFVVPIIDNKLSHKEWNNKRGGKYSYTKLQDRYEEFNKPLFNLIRVKKNPINQITHRTIKQHYKTIKKLRKYTKLAIKKTKNKFTLNMPKKFLGMFYKEADIKKALKNVSNANVKELVALKNENVNLETDLSAVKQNNIKLELQNRKLKEYYNKNKPKIDFVNKALKYNLINEFKRELNKKAYQQQQKEKEQVLEEKQKKEEQLKQEEALKQQQFIQQTPTLNPHKKLKI